MRLFLLLSILSLLTVSGCEHPDQEVIGHLRSGRMVVLKDKLKLKCIDGFVVAHIDGGNIFLPDEIGSPYQCIDFCRKYPNRCNHLDKEDIPIWEDLYE